MKEQQRSKMNNHDYKTTIPTRIYKRTPEEVERLKHRAKQLQIFNTGKKFSEARKRTLWEKAGNWKGDKVKYRALHSWVIRRLGRPLFCEHCGNRDLKNRQYNWANKSRTYKRVLSDWIRLCVKCHAKYDKKPTRFCKCGKVYAARGLCKYCYNKTFYGKNIKI